jgi:hypothetical protein
MPGGREFADAAKMDRLGPFDWNNYRPIQVLDRNGVLYIEDGMTRAAVAQRAGINYLPAYVRKP